VRPFVVLPLGSIAGFVTEAYLGVEVEQAVPFPFPVRAWYLQLDAVLSWEKLRVEVTRPEPATFAHNPFKSLAPPSGLTRYLIESGLSDVGTSQPLSPILTARAPWIGVGL
jgi:hypothetical protein